ncbi:6-bladed beta-propeller [Roseivirga sp.]|uniref:6-bladed beta-propeller n=1 Tax=Roseivirga sp. TaxID=1964215 RepID=UPI002B27718B|nr:6-bladed beta-propeller [Roseivirga sp.]
MIKLISSFVFLLFTLNLTAQTPPKFEHFKIDIDAPMVNFFEAIEHIEIIRLEETEKTLLGEIEHYFKTPSGFVIPYMPINKPARLILFNEQGNYINEISKNGLGPEEYRNISDAWFKDGQIALFSGWSRRIQRYTEAGEYVESIEAKYDKSISGWAMIPYQKGYVFHQIGTPPNGNELIFTDNLLSLTGKSAPVAKPHPLPFNQRKVFSSLGESIFYVKPLRDSVLQIINSKAYPRFKFDFGNEWLWSNPKHMKSPVTAMNAMSAEAKVYMVYPYIGEWRIFLTYLFYENKVVHQKKGYIDRETGDFFRFDLRKKDKEDYNITFLTWEDDRLVSSIQAYDFEEFMDNLDNDQWTVAGGFDLEEIFQSENPVLLKIKFK